MNMGFEQEPQYKVQYCCVAREGRVLWAYGGGDHGMESLAAVCLERIPAYHRWYFQSKGRRTLGFLMEDGYVYFAIADHGVGNSVVLRFLESMRDEFRRVSGRGELKGSLSNVGSVCLEQQLLPEVLQLIGSLNHLSRSGHHDSDVGMTLTHGEHPRGYREMASGTKSPLLESTERSDGKAKDHVITVKDMDNHSDPNNQCLRVASSLSMQRELNGGGLRRSASRSIRGKWCWQVRIIIVAGIVICVLLLVAWLVICHGFECLR